MIYMGSMYSENWIYEALECRVLGIGKNQPRQDPSLAVILEPVV